MQRGECVVGEAGPVVDQLEVVDVGQMVQCELEVAVAVLCLCLASLLSIFRSRMCNNGNFNLLTKINCEDMKGMKRYCL